MATTFTSTRTTVNLPEAFGALMDEIEKHPPETNNDPLSVELTRWNNRVLTIFLKKNEERKANPSKEEEIEREIERELVLKVDELQEILKNPLDRRQPLRAPVLDLRPKHQRSRAWEEVSLDNHRTCYRKCYPTTGDICLSPFDQQPIYVNPNPDYTKPEPDLYEPHVYARGMIVWNNTFFPSPEEVEPESRLKEVSTKLAKMILELCQLQANKAMHAQEDLEKVWGNVTFTKAISKHLEETRVGIEGNIEEVRKTTEAALKTKEAEVEIKFKTVMESCDQRNAEIMEEVTKVRGSLDETQKDLTDKTAKVFALNLNLTELQKSNLDLVRQIQEVRQQVANIPKRKWWHF